MKFSIVALSCAVLFAGSASGATTVKGSKSNGSFKEAVPCTTPACCIQHPNANGCVGSLLKSQANLPRHPRDTGPQPPSSVTTSPKNSAHASEKTTTTNNSKSNSYKEAAPTPPASEQFIIGGAEVGAAKAKTDTKANASEKTATIKSTKSNTSDKTTTTNNSKSNTFKEIAPTPPASEQRLVNGTKSNTYKEIAPTPGPTPKPVENKNLNSNRTN